MSKMDSLAAPSKGIYFAVVLQSMCDRMNSPSAAAHRFLLAVPFLPGFDSFGTYLFPPLVLLFYTALEVYTILG